MTKVIAAMLIMCVCVVVTQADERADAGAEGKKKGKWVALFNGKDLTGWKLINGTAKYTVEKGAIVGTTVAGSPNSFLCSKKDYGDFELEFEVKLDPELNSGVQIRSHSAPEYKNGRVHGYQVEISTNGHAGFVYDEARRGKFLNDGIDDPEKQAKFNNEGWNKYRVVCQADSIRTWVNGKQVSDLKDDMTKSGFIGLQVHSVGGDPHWQVRWRNLRLRER